MHGKIIVLLMTAAASHGICAGEIYRCTAANGDVMYTNLACPAKSQSSRLPVTCPEKDSPPPVRTLRPRQQLSAHSRRARRRSRHKPPHIRRAQAAEYQAEYQTESGAHSYDDNVYYPAWFGAYPFRHSRHDGHHHGHEVVHHGQRRRQTSPNPRAPRTTDGAGNGQRHRADALSGQAQARLPALRGETTGGSRAHALDRYESSQQGNRQ